MTKATKLRTRAGTWRSFERRFQPIDSPDGTVYWRWDELPTPIDPTRVWTIVDCDGRLYVTPGLRVVNRIDYVYCAVPWTEADERQPDYRYD